MIPIWLRTLMILAAAALGTLLARQGQAVISLLMIGVIIMIIVGYFRTGTVILAFRQVGKLHYDKADKYLRQIIWPDMLKTTHRGFYWFSKAMIQMDRKQWRDAGQSFTNALSKGVRTSNNKAIIYLNLAAVHLQMGQPKEALVELKKAKNTEHHEDLDAQIKIMRERIKEVMT